MEHDVLNDNPKLKRPVLALLALMDADGAARRRNEVEGAAADVWSASFAQSPAVVIDILVRKGALREQVYVDGEPYEGALEDVQTDQGVADDAQAWSSLSLTGAGRALREDHEPHRALAALFDERPQYADVLSAVLWACDTGDGCGRPDIEAQIAGLPALQPGADGRKAVYPQYFIDALETAGGIVWDGAWHTTDAGRAVMADR